MRPDEMFTASDGLIVWEVGTLRPESLGRIVEVLRPPRK